jgi:hypothetical protein
MQRSITFARPVLNAEVEDLAAEVIRSTSHRAGLQSSQARATRVGDSYLQELEAGIEAKHRYSKDLDELNAWRTHSYIHYIVPFLLSLIKCRYVQKGLLPDIMFPSQPRRLHELMQDLYRWRS